MATEGRYVFRHCAPNAPFDIINTSPAALQERAFSFIVNAPVELQSLLDNGAWDPRNILRGYNGRMYDGEGNYLFHVNTFRAQAAPTTRPYQPSGQKQEWGIPVSYSVTLTMTEVAIKDELLLQKVLNGLAEGLPDADLTFQATLRV